MDMMRDLQKGIDGISKQMEKSFDGLGDLGFNEPKPKKKVKKKKLRKKKVKKSRAKELVDNLNKKEEK